ncbi:MAG: hypothetical protein ACI37T_09095 [Candidatus Gastranaerophilaceae bacterium]
MGYLLMFARSLQQTAKKNQLTYETIKIQNQKDNITNQLADIQQMENAMIAQAQQNGEEAPDMSYLNSYRSILNFMSSSLDIRLQTIQTQLAKISSEEQSINDSLNAQIQSSVPKYGGR